MIVNNPSMSEKTGPRLMYSFSSSFLRFFMSSSFRCFCEQACAMIDFIIVGFPFAFLAISYFRNCFFSGWRSGRNVCIR